jgi:hypothetical protein
VYKRENEARGQAGGLDVEVDLFGDDGAWPEEIVLSA